VGLWITILPLSIDAGRLDVDLQKVFEQAIAEKGNNIRLDTTLQHLGFKADATGQGDAGRFWIITGGDLVLFASSQVPATEPEIWNPQFDRLMASLEITRDREVLLQRTADDLQKRLRELHPDQDYRIEGDAIRGRSQRISLAGVYNEVAASPLKRKQIVERFVEGLSSMAAAPGQEQLEHVRENIMPLFKPAAYLKAGIAGRLAVTPWMADVIICYAIRSAKAMRLLTDWDLQRWNITQDALHGLAIENLSRMPWPERLDGARQAGGRVIIVASHDNLDASRLLHPELHRLFSKPLGRSFYAGIPNRDTLVVFSRGNLALFNHVVGQLRRDHDLSSNPITPQPFLVSADGIAPEIEF